MHRYTLNNKKAQIVKLFIEYGDCARIDPNRTSDLV